MKTIICTVIFCLLIVLRIQATQVYQPGDSLVSKDTLNKNSEIIVQKKSEIEITFNKSNLAPQNVRIIFNELFKQYLTVKDALVYNDSYNAKRNTLKLLDDMKSKTKDIDILSNDDRWTIFIKNFDNVRNKVESTTFISEQRFLFNEITNGIGDFIKQYGLNDKTIYFMQCQSDSETGNGKWFSDKRDKKNPYLGLLNDTICVNVMQVWKF